MQGLNTALRHVPQLTVSLYLQQVLQAVQTGTLNPTYHPPQVYAPNPSNLHTDSLNLAEHHLYGSSRLGIETYGGQEYLAVWKQGISPAPSGLRVTTLNTQVPWYSGGFADWIRKDRAATYTGSTFNISLEKVEEQRMLGRKRYELTDHLGNVLATVMDRKSGYGSAGGLYTGFNANLASVSDVYPFGMPIVNRSKAFGDYQFGYNGQMKSDEVYGKGNLNTAMFWEYDTRLGRRWNVDPVLKVQESSYASFGNSPFWLVDVDGADSALYNSNSGQLISKRVTAKDDKTALWTVDPTAKGYDSKHPWKTARRLTYAVGGKQKKVSGNSLRNRHPLTGKGWTVGDQVYAEDLLDMTQEFNGIVNNNMHVFAKLKEYGHSGNYTTLDPEYY